MFKIPYHIVLGSNSPRRKELLQQLGFDFVVKKFEVDETFPPDLEVKEIPLFLAKKKGEHQKMEMHPSELIITADTIVICDGKPMGKPIDYDDAIEMLQFLSDKTHLVISGVCATTVDKTISFSSTTEVTFKSLSLEEIAYYVRNYQPLDKAGAYGIQEWIGMIGISKIKGSYYNVMGLPVDQLFNVLRDHFMK